MLVVAEAKNSCSSSRRECRYYFCDICKSYHVTSTEKREFTSNIPSFKGLGLSGVIKI